MQSGTAIQQTSDRGYIMAGGSYDPPDRSGLYLIKADSNGDSLWAKIYKTIRVGNDIQQTFDGGYIVTGDVDAKTITDVYLLKTDAEGDSIWAKTYDYDVTDMAHSCQQTNDGGYIIAGYTTYGAYNEAVVLLIKTDSIGETLWTRTFGSGENEHSNSVIQTSDGGYVIAGETRAFGAGSSDFYLIKTNSEGTLNIINKGGDSLPFPKDWMLSQNYPNPFNPSTTISFSIPDISGQAQPVSLTVYDIRGRWVRTLFDSELDPGSHKIHWDGRNDRGESVASGIFLYTLKTGGEVYTRKMVVLK